MKKIILKPKAIMLTFLFFGILAILIPVTVVWGFGAAATGSASNGYRLYANSQSGVLHLVDTGASETNICLQNNTAYDYFLPSKTATEYYYFSLKKITQDAAIIPYVCCTDGRCEGSETYSNCPTDCAPPVSQCGDGICSNGETSASCPGDCPGACLDSTGSNIPGGYSCTNGLGSNDYCFYNGIYSFGTSGGIGYVVDTNCRSLNSAQQCTHVQNCAWFNPLPQVHMWCGNNTCDTSIGEGCSTCYQDCGGCSGCPGSCPASCGDGVCNGGETCSTCSQDCGGCTGSCSGAAGCSNYTTQFSCQKFGCLWNAAFAS